MIEEDGDIDCDREGSEELIAIGIGKTAARSGKGVLSDLKYPKGSFRR
jgi:hypothetical protein